MTETQNEDEINDKLKDILFKNLNNEENDENLEDI